MRMMHQIVDQTHNFHSLLSTWYKGILIDPIEGTAEFGISRAQQGLVIGGEANLREKEIDAPNLQHRASPRGCALVQMMRGNRHVHSVALAYTRITRMV
eukprot:COSAG02_NODE_3851_length_6147_cov_3.345899_3_plen_99_part_00